MPTPAATDEVRDGARLLARVIEPLVGQVYFAPECHERYRRSGSTLSPFSTGRGRRPARRPRLLHQPRLGARPGARRARGRRLRRVQRRGGGAGGDVRLDAHRRRRPSPTARLDGAVEQLRADPRRRRPTASTAPTSCLGRAVAPLEPWGRALFAGTLAQALPGTPLGDLFRLGDRLREFRGDSHIAAWVAAGPRRHRDRAAHRALLGHAEPHLRAHACLERRAARRRRGAASEAAGLIADGTTHRLGPRRSARQIELATDAQMAPAIEALGDDLDELAGLLEPWAQP